MILCPPRVNHAINLHTDEFNVPLFIFNKLTIFSVINFVLLSAFKWVVIVSVQFNCALQLFTPYFCSVVHAPFFFCSSRIDREITLRLRRMPLSMHDFSAFYWNRHSDRSYKWNKRSACTDTQSHAHNRTHSLKHTQIEAAEPTNQPIYQHTLFITLH